MIPGLVGGRQVPPAVTTVWIHFMWEWLPICGGPECVPGSGGVAGRAEECDPMQ